MLHILIECVKFIIHCIFGIYEFIVLILISCKTFLSMQSIFTLEERKPIAEEKVGYINVWNCILVMFLQDLLLI